MIKMICELIYDVSLHNIHTQDHEDRYFFVWKKIQFIHMKNLNVNELNYKKL